MRREEAACVRDSLYPVARLEHHAPVRASGVQGSQQLERIDMAVHRRVAGADHLRPDLGQSLQQGRAVQDLVRVLAVHFIADRCKPLAARLELGP